MKFFKNIFKKKSLSDHLYSIKKVKVKDILFEIKKIDSLDYMEGSKVLQKTFDTYANKKINEKDSDVSMKKIKEYYTDIFLAGVVKPKLSRKDEGSEIYVGELFRDWDLCQILQEEIFAHTYGKKKVMSAIYQEKKS